MGLIRKFKYVQNEKFRLSKQCLVCGLIAISSISAILRLCGIFMKLDIGEVLPKADKSR